MPDPRGGNRVRQPGAHLREPLAAATLEPVAQPGGTKGKIIGQHAHRFRELGDRDQPARIEQIVEHAQRCDLVADVMQREGRPDHIGRFEGVESAGQLGEVGADSGSESLLGRPVRRALEHGRRAVDGDDLRVGEPARELARADAGTAPDVDDPTHRRRIRTAELRDPRGGVGHEGEEDLAFELGVSSGGSPV